VALGLSTATGHWRAAVPRETIPLPPSEADEPEAVTVA
jgi:hypothetical protein